MKSRSITGGYYLYRYYNVYRLHYQRSSTLQLKLHKYGFSVVEKEQENLSITKNDELLYRSPSVIF